MTVYTSFYRLVLRLSYIVEVKGAGTLRRICAEDCDIVAMRELNYPGCRGGCRCG